MLKYSLSIILGITFWISSCSTGRNSEFKQYVTNDSITHNKFNEIYISKGISDEMNLPFICEGVDSFELRIWLHGFITRKDLIIFRYTSGQWKNYRTEYYQTENGIDSAFTYKIDVNGDMSNLVNFLSSSKVLELPSWYAIPNFHNNIADGQDCIIEIATNSFYKYIDYQNPEYFADKEPNNKIFMQIVDFINRYFAFYFPLNNKQAGK